MPKHKRREIPTLRDVAPIEHTPGAKHPLGTKLVVKTGVGPVVQRTGVARESEIRQSEMAEMVGRMQAAMTAAPSTGLCPAGKHGGKHGLDYPGQPCDLCPSRPTLAAALTPQTQAESWAVLAALRMFVDASTGVDTTMKLEHLPVLRAMLARGEGLE